VRSTCARQAVSSATSTRATTKVISRPTASSRWATSAAGSTASGWSSLALEGHHHSLGREHQPKEVEDALYGHPAVAEVAIVAMPSARTGEMGCAFIIRARPDDRPARSGALPRWRRHGRAEVPGTCRLVDDLPRVLRARCARTFCAPREGIGRGTRGLGQLSEILPLSACAEPSKHRTSSESAHSGTENRTVLRRAQRSGVAW